MARTLTLALAVAGSILIAGCGGSSGLTLNAYTVRGNEEPGYEASKATDYKLAGALGQTQGGYTTADVTRLEHEGFKGAAVENTGGQEGLSYVIELGSVAGAAGEDAAILNQNKQNSEHHVLFAVPAIPGATGIAYPNPGGGGGGGNVVFTIGRCVLLVGDEGSGAGYRAPAVDGATAIYKRTHGRAGACSV